MEGLRNLGAKISLGGIYLSQYMISKVNKPKFDDKVLSINQQLSKLDKRITLDTKTFGSLFGQNSGNNARAFFSAYKLEEKCKILNLPKHIFEKFSALVKAVRSHEFLINLTEYEATHSLL